MSTTGVYMSDKEEQEPRFQLCESSSHFAKVAVAVTAVALVLHIVAVASPNWIMVDYRGDEIGHGGLWIECKVYGLYTTKSVWVCDGFAASHHLDSSPGFMKASQALAIVGLVEIVLMLFLLSLYTLLPKLAGRKAASVGIFVLSVTAGLNIIIGAIVYASEYPTPQDILKLHEWTFGFAFAFQFVVGILSFAVSVLVVLDIRKEMVFGSLRFF